MKPIEKAQRDCAEIAAQYGVSRSSVIWIGGNKYIVVKDGNQIRV